MDELPKEKIWSDSWDKRFRWLYPKACKQCSKIKHVPKHAWHKRDFCSKECRYIARQKKVEVTCDWCSKTIVRTPSKFRGSKSGYFFCNRQCKEEAQCVGGLKEIQPPHYENGIHEYRQKALRFIGKKCQVCGYDKEVRMLDVHHKDSNRSNNLIDNLEVLCVWCHATKTRKVEWHEWNMGY